MNAPADKPRLTGLGDIKIPGPGKLTVGDIALSDPRLAYSLLGQMWAGGAILPGGIVNSATIGLCCAFGWEMIDVAGCFTVGDCGKCVIGVHCQLSGDLLVRKVVTTVRRPNFAPGSGFKGQWDFFNAKNPNIDVELQITSYCRYIIADTPVPLENLEVMFDCECPPLFILRCNASILARFTNRRALAPDELPLDVHVTFHAIRLPIPYDSCGLGDAVSWLTNNGVCCGGAAAVEAARSTRIPLLGEAPAGK